jgi:nitroreductase
MNFLELARKRTSVRKYLDKAVPRPAIERCLEAARLAPSACNAQPWQFIVVTKAETRIKLAEGAFNGIYSMNSFAAQAPVLIAVVKEKKISPSRLGSLVRRTDYSLMDIGIACDHLTLQATEEGLGTCWLGWFDDKAVKKVLGLPRAARVEALISLGYAATETPRPKVRKTLSEMSRLI